MKDIKAALRLLVVCTVLCGGIYPLLVTLIAQSFFPRQAAGSLIADSHGRVAGSVLIGQPFTGQGYFWSRPSATTPFPYNPLASGGSNLGPTNSELFRQVTLRLDALGGPMTDREPPVDMLFASASGLDPHISPQAAMFQVPRVAKARNMEVERLALMVSSQVEGRTLWFLGEPRVNVLRLNLALEEADHERHLPVR